MQPWKLLADPAGYIFKWLVGYSGGLGSIAGVMIADYWLVRKKKLVLGDLYRTRGVYTYTRRLELAGGLSHRYRVHAGVDWIGGAGLKPLYDYAWFVGFGASALVHLVLMKSFPPQPSDA